MTQNASIKDTFHLNVEKLTYFLLFQWKKCWPNCQKQNKTKNRHPALNVEFNLSFSSKSYLLTAVIKKQNFIARHLNNLKEDIYVGRKKKSYSFF